MATPIAVTLPRWRASVQLSGAVKSPWQYPQHGWNRHVLWTKGSKVTHAVVRGQIESNNQCVSQKISLSKMNLTILFLINRIRALAITKGFLEGWRADNLRA